MNIKKIVQQIQAKHRFNDPYELADCLGIYIRFDDLGKMQGYFHMSNRVKQIVINTDLPEHLKRFVLYHEIGHSIMHPDCNTPFLQSTFLSVDKLEIEANKFAVELLIPDKDLGNLQDYTISQLACCYGLPEEIVKLKFK